MITMLKLNLKLKYYIFNYNRFFRWGIESPYYKSKINATKKEIERINKMYFDYHNLINNVCKK